MSFRGLRHALLNLLLLLPIQNPPVSATPTGSSARYDEHDIPSGGRDRVNINTGWRFLRSETNPDGLSYDIRPGLPSTNNTEVLKPWILPSGNRFIKDAAKRHSRPAHEPKTNVTFAQKSYDDGSWETVNLPHDWAIKGPFYEGNGVPVSGGMGRLPVQGVGWYRRTLTVRPEDKGKLVYLEVDGAMSYAMVWLNGKLIGGWPYPYNSFSLDLTPYLVSGGENLLAIRLDNPTESSRWYPGGGIYRSVWLTKVDPVHVAQWGTFFTTKHVSAQSATVDATLQVENSANTTTQVEVAIDVHEVDPATGRAGEKVASFPTTSLQLSGGETRQVNGSVTVDNPRLWGPPPRQRPNLYTAITHLYSQNKTIDSYETKFGIRSITYDAEKGLLVNQDPVRIQGVNMHHDLGALGAAFNVRAAERQLQVLQEMGCNAIRMAHNPPASEFLELTDRMGFAVIDEVFDMWELKKTNADTHLIFPDWHEADLRAFLRRDRNHPSIIAWSFGNEVGEQTTGEAGALLASTLHDMVRSEDPTRPTTASMNAAAPDMPFPASFDLLSLNYQGEGIRNAPDYAHLTTGRRTKPLYPDFHAAFPNNLLLSSETAAAVSTRGTYLFPPTLGISAPVNETNGGGNASLAHVSAYELYTADFGSSPDKVFATQDANPFVAGEFVWSGWDYLGEPTPYYTARSSYFGIIDLAGFKKDRFHLYQARWRPELPTAHLLPHWSWPASRINHTTPVHVFSAAAEAELFVNGASQGRRTKGSSSFRFRWDDVVYVPGEVRVVTYRNGTVWAEERVRTAGPAAKLVIEADRSTLSASHARDGKGSDLAFLTVRVVDDAGNLVPYADHAITFEIEAKNGTEQGTGQIVATDNGDPTDFTPFPSRERKAFGGLALGIVAVEKGRVGVTARAEGLGSVRVEIAAL